ncbi:putative aldouronate transport system permease protein [Paenibacillus rhizosphaerae]|uniref:Putative aldouronate transport system permease protein n=1 Tax=Paenibacillus rhizosphaerae TaxID=297318 RepID=A0A839TFS1_9BACL|nr:ABC transporter permease subunit [Paenibacillus rhizosphaerae]MBB3125353.1 putative aldouronate transport system permease protein [Paenibacillus rhizosphaerae]
MNAPIIQQQSVGSSTVPSVRVKSQYWKRAFPYYFMILPGLLYLLIFRYAPMFGLFIAFKKYSPFQGVWGSEWVGFDHFVRLFTESDFLLLLKNTLILNLLDVLVAFPFPILIAVLLNEVGRKYWKNSIQTIMYAPHFLSWVVIVGITMLLFRTQDGGINALLGSLGLNRIELMTDPHYFRFVWLFHNIWQGAGWGAIIYLASIASIDPALYEAARVDGASRLRQILHITLPSLKTIILIMLILRLGNFIDVGFEHVFLLQNPLNLEVSDVFETYIYRQGLVQGDFSYVTAVGLFKSVVGLVMVVSANAIAKRFGEEGVY